MILTGLLNYQPERLLSLDVRFSSVVYPGETLAFEFWLDDKTVSFQAFSKERGKKVLDNGRALVR
jgi:acyl dehydratase